MNNINHITTNFRISGPLRYDQLEGKDYIVAPISMITPGIHNGSNGSLRYTEEELEKTPQVWDTKPLVVYHPEINGKGVSACSKTVLNNRKIGLIMNTRYDNGKLRCEGWFDPERTLEVDERVYNALLNCEMMEVSTGLFSDLDGTPGEQDGQEFIGTVMNIRPDHLAILPDKIGACSIADGAGLFQLNHSTQDLSLSRSIQGFIAGAVTQKKVLELLKNARTHSDIHSDLFQLVRDMKGDDAWIEDVFDNGTFIYHDGDKLFRLNYSSSDSGTVVTGDPVEVLRVTEYKEAMSSPIGNSDASETTEKDDMSKETKVQNLIDNTLTQFKDTDKDWLLNLEEDQLDSMVPVANGDPDDNDDDDDDVDGDDEDGGKTTTNSSSVLKPVKVVSTDEYISNAPPEIQELLKAGQTQLNERKSSLIKTITDNVNNKFKDEYLKGRTVEELEGIAALCGNGSTQVVDSNQQSYFGASGVGNPISNTDVPKFEGMSTPVFNWEKARNTDNKSSVTN